MIKQFKLSRTMKEIIAQLNHCKAKTYVVGGAVRDAVLGQEPKDLDFATDYDIHELHHQVWSMGHHMIEDKTALSHGIIRVIDPDATGTTGRLIDFAQLRRDDKTDGRHAIVTFTESIEEDLARRDFTMNAIAAEIDAEGTVLNIVDPFNGIGRLQDPAKRIEFVGKAYQRIDEDALRMIRACRFTALGDDFFLDPQDEGIIEGCAERVKTLSKERIHDEFIKALSYPKPSQFFRSMQRCGLLRHIMPDLEQGVGCVQNIYHSANSVVCKRCGIRLTDKEFSYLKQQNLSHC